MTRTGKTAHRPWARVDNAANIFVATMSDLDTKVFRLGAELDHEVDTNVLQQALDKVHDRFPLYHSVMRRGFFWYYLEASDLRPRVKRDKLVPFEHLYSFDRRELLYRVVHHRRRISLEVFHALSDGTGAWVFFRALITEYVRLRKGTAVAENANPPGTTLADDSFADYFGVGRRRGSNPATDEPSEERRKMFGSEQGPKVLRVRGEVTPDQRNRLVEFTMSAQAVLEQSRTIGVSLTVYLVALFFEAVRKTSPEIEQRPRVAITVPVNLRAQFPSESARNFFSVTRLEHTFGEGDDSVEAIAHALKAQLGTQITKDALEAQVDQLIKMEKHPILRFVPRVVKDAILSLVNRINEGTLTLAMSGLGKLKLEEDVDDDIRELHLSVASPRPQMCIMMHKDWLTIGFTTPFVDTTIFAAFAELLQEAGTDVAVDASRVTHEELDDAVR